MEVEIAGVVWIDAVQDNAIDIFEPKDELLPPITISCGTILKHTQEYITLARDVFIDKDALATVRSRVTIPAGMVRGIVKIKIKI